jgi:hypothetical protein
MFEKLRKPAQAGERAIDTGREREFFLRLLFSKPLIDLDMSSKVLYAVD